MSRKLRFYSEDILYNFNRGRMLKFFMNKRTGLIVAKGFSLF